MNCYTRTTTNQPSTINTKQPIHEPSPSIHELSPPIHLYMAAKCTIEHFHVVTVNKMYGPKSLIQQFHGIGLSGSTTPPADVTLKRCNVLHGHEGTLFIRVEGQEKKQWHMQPFTWGIHRSMYDCIHTPETPTVLNWGRPLHRSMYDGIHTPETPTVLNWGRPLHRSMYDGIHTPVTPTVLSWGRLQQQSQQHKQAETDNFLPSSATVLIYTLVYI